MGDSVHNVCQKGCMNINWKSLFTKSILFEIHITCIDDYHNALCSGCLNCNWNIMSFRRGVWISTWIAYSSSLDYLNFTLPVLKVNIICLMQWVYEFHLEWYSEGVYESRLKYPIHLVYWNAHSLYCRLTYMPSAVGVCISTGVFNISRGMNINGNSPFSMSIHFLKYHSLVLKVKIKEAHFAIVELVNWKADVTTGQYCTRSGLLPWSAKK